MEAVLFGCLAILLVLIIVLVVYCCWSRDQEKKKCCKKRKHKSAGCGCGSPVYGEFIRPFTFTPELPIVQPGGSLVFPVPTVPPAGVSYIDDVQGTGLLVPEGTYLVSWTLNPSTGAAVNLLVNGQDPITVATTVVPTQYFYGKSLTIGPLDDQYVVRAPLEEGNLISLVNAGDSLFSLDSIPNTHIGDTAFITHVRVQRLGPA